MSEFHFLRPYSLLAFLPLMLLLWLLWQQKYNSRSWRAVCDPRLLNYLLVDTAGRQKKWPLVLTGLMASLLIIALAGPVWQRLEQPVFREQSALVIVLDLSRSMDATDIKPSRLARARHKIRDILHKRKEGQTALLVYAADTYTVSPLTDDSNTMIALVKTLSTDLMPAQGSAPGKAIEQAIKLLKQAGAVHGHILLVTDGVKSSQQAKLAKHATANGHQLSVLGVGTAQGAPISIAGGGLLKDSSGAIVVPKLDGRILQQLASQGGGRYHRLTADERDLDHLVSGMTAQGLNAQGKETGLHTDHWREQGPWLLLFVLPFAALAFRRGYLALLLMICLPGLPRPVYAMDWDSLWQRPDQRAARQLQQNTQPDKIPPAEVFSDPQWQATAHYRAGQYQQAIDALQGIDHAEALYNKGNALAKLGKLPEALQAYDEALKKAPAHTDAQYNREQVEKKLKQQESTDPSQQDGKQDPSDSDQQQKQDSQQEQSKTDQQQKQDQDQDQNPASDETDKNEQQDQSAKKDHSEEQESQDIKQSKEDKQDKKEQQAQETQQQQSKDEQQKQAESQAREEKTEQMQATEQWLRRIPDDPGGLLRRKFYYEYQRKKQQQAETKNPSGSQAW